jgi:tetratricopeptide (TPR) repeat protein
VRGAAAGREALWQRARTPGLDAYCDALARGYSRLRRKPELSLEAAMAADKALGGRAAPSVLAGQALLLLGRHNPAWQSFERAQSRSKRALEAPAALHDLALAAELSGHHDEAREAYRALVARAFLLEQSLRRQRIYVEAAMLMMGLGPDGLNEAIGYLSEARRRGVPPGFSPYVLGALALALDRQGHQDEARGVAGEAGGPWALLSEAGALDDEQTEASRKKSAPQSAVPTPYLPEGEIHAMIAVLAERGDPVLARERWQAFLGGPAAKGPWAEHARKKLSKLEGRRPQAGGASR